MSATNKDVRIVPISAGEQALRQVFRDDDPVSGRFTERLRCRAILYRVDYALVPAQLDAVLHGARAVGDDSFYVYFLERVDDVSFREVRSVRAYYELPLLQNAIFSPTGAWGIFVSDVGIGTVGGTATFFKSFCEAYPLGLTEQLQWFIHDFVDVSGGDVDDWIPPLLLNIYGRQEALRVARGHDALANKIERRADYQS